MEAVVAQVTPEHGAADSTTDVQRTGHWVVRVSGDGFFVQDRADAYRLPATLNINLLRRATAKQSTDLSDHARNASMSRDDITYCKHTTTHTKIGDASAVHVSTTIDTERSEGGHRTKQLW